MIQETFAQTVAVQQRHCFQSKLNSITYTEIMKNKTLKLQLYTQDEDGEAEFLDFWLQLVMVDGFYIPKLEDGELPSINLLVNGAFITVLQEADIMEYLNYRFG